MSKEKPISRFPSLDPDTKQSVLWLKSACIHRIEEIENRLSDDVYTGQMTVDGKSNTFGFSEQYVNLLIELAYKKGVEDQRKQDEERITQMSEVLTIIHDISFGY